MPLDFTKKGPEEHPLLVSLRLAIGDSNSKDNLVLVKSTLVSEVIETGTTQVAKLIKNSQKIRHFIEVSYFIYVPPQNYPL